MNAQIDSYLLDDILRQLGWGTAHRNRLESAQRPLRAEKTALEVELREHGGQIIATADPTPDNYARFKRIAELANEEKADQATASLPYHLR